MSSNVSFWMQNQFYNRVAGSLLPMTWFAQPAPRPEQLSTPDGLVQLQIVSHCWQYSHLAIFQLSSLINHPPQNCHLTYTLLNQTLGERGTIDIDTELFRRNVITKAKGAFQIVHGDVARAVGYCGSIALYQQPSECWRKTYEDTVFRRVIGYDGVAIPVAGLYRIRHAEKGRYAKDSSLSRIRGGIRKASDKTQSE